MTQLQYSTGSFRTSRAQTQTSPQQRLVGIAFAVTVEAVLVYTLLLYTLNTLVDFSYGIIDPRVKVE